MTSGGNGGVGSGGDKGPGGNKKKMSELSKEEHKDYVSKATKKYRLISNNLKNNSISLTRMLVIVPSMGHNCTFTVDPTPTAHNLPVDGTNTEESEQYFYQSLHYNFHLWFLEHGYPRDFLQGEQSLFSPTILRGGIFQYVIKAEALLFFGIASKLGFLSGLQYTVQDKFHHGMVQQPKVLASLMSDAKINLVVACDGMFCFEGDAPETSTTFFSNIANSLGIKCFPPPSLIHFFMDKWRLNDSIQDLRLPQIRMEFINWTQVGNDAMSYFREEYDQLSPPQLQGLPPLGDKLVAKERYGFGSDTVYILTHANVGGDNWEWTASSVHESPGNTRDSPLEGTEVSIEPFAEELQQMEYRLFASCQGHSSIHLHYATSTNPDPDGISIINSNVTPNNGNTGYKMAVRNGFAALFTKHPHLFGTNAIRSKLVLRFDLFTVGAKVWINEIHLFPEASPLLTDFPHEHIVLLKGWRQLIERTSEYISFMTTTASSV